MMAGGIAEYPELMSLQLCELRKNILYFPSAMETRVAERKIVSQTKKVYTMSKRTLYLIIGIGIASILSGMYGAIRTGEAMESLSGIVIGVALIGAALIEKRNQDKAS